MLASSPSIRASSAALPQSALATRMSAAVIVSGGQARRRNGSPNVTCRPVASVAPRSTAHFCSGEGTNRKRRDRDDDEQQDDDDADEQLAHVSPRPASPGQLGRVTRLNLAHCRSEPTRNAPIALGPGRLGRGAWL